MKNKNMNPKLTVFLFCCLLFGFAGNFMMAAASETFAKGTVIEKVVCRISPLESYLLYLPTSYNEQQKWPVLFIFEPGGRVTFPVPLFKEAAEKFGYILVCPTNVKNGPGEPIFKAMRAVWTDLCARFAVDKGRIYAAGFSGGARVATFFNQAINNPVQGIIACGAGLSQAVQFIHIKTMHFYGIAGYGDFNYSEMVSLEKNMADQGIPHRFIFFPGNHAWPPADICWRGVEWLELMALKTGIIPKDNRLDFINETFEKEIKLAQTRVETGETYYAVADYEGIIRLYDGLKPVDDLKQRVGQLRQTKEFKSFEKDERQRLEEEQGYIKQISGGFAYLYQNLSGEVRVEQVIMNMGIPRLVRQLKNKKNKYDAAMAERLLFNISMKCDGDVDEYMKNRDFKRAALAIEIGIESGINTPFSPYFLYQRGSLYAREGNRKKALKYLQEAVKDGFKNYDYMEKDKYLDIIRDTPQYQQLLEQLKKDYPPKTSRP